MVRGVLLGSLLVLSLCLPARGEESPSVPPTGVVFVAGGVGGLDPLGAWAKLVLPWAGVPHEVREFAWTTGFGRLVRDVQDTRNLQVKADRLASEVLLFKEAHPNSPVYLVGHSGGTGVLLVA